jgi:hypothetical protein
MRHSSVGAAASKADAERTALGVPAARTQTIEFAPYPRPRHRTSRDKSRNAQPTSDVNGGNLTTNAFSTGYDTRAPITALPWGFTDPMSRIYWLHRYSPLSNRNYADISKYNSSCNTRQLWWLSGSSRDHIPYTSSLLTWRAPATYTYHNDAAHNHHHVYAGKY